MRGKEHCHEGFLLDISRMKYIDAKTKKLREDHVELPLLLVLHPTKTFMSILVLEDKLDKTSMEAFLENRISRLTLLGLKDKELSPILADMISRSCNVAYKQIHSVNFDPPPNTLFI